MLNKTEAANYPQVSDISFLLAYRCFMMFLGSDNNYTS